MRRCVESRMCTTDRAGRHLFVLLPARRLPRNDGGGAQDGLSPGRAQEVDVADGLGQVPAFVRLALCVASPLARADPRCPAAQQMVRRSVQLEAALRAQSRLSLLASESRPRSLLLRFILQYAVLRPATTLAAVITNATGHVRRRSRALLTSQYCLASWAPQFAHVYCTTVISLSVTVAMYSVLQARLLSRTGADPLSST